MVRKRHIKSFNFREILADKGDVSRLISLQLLIIFGWWRLWKIPLDNISIPYVELFRDQSIYFAMIPYSLLFGSGSWFLITRKLKAIPIYIFSLLWIILQDKMVYHHGIFTTILFLTYYLNERKKFFDEKILFGTLYILAVIPKLNSEFLSGEITDYLLNTYLNIKIGFIGGLSAVLLELLGAILFLLSFNNKTLSNFLSISLICFHSIMGLILQRGVLFNFLFVLAINRNFLKSRLPEKVYFILAMAMMTTKIIWYKFFN